jgi:hypothetical protein
MKTPIPQCEHMSLHARTMLGKFSSVTALDGLAGKLDAATVNLLTRQAAYDANVKALIVARAEVKYVDVVADKEVRMGLRVAELEDGEPGGRVSTALFPNGTTPIIKPVGSTQVKEMRALEGRYKEVESIFPAAASERQKIAALREQYEAALTARSQGMEQGAQARAARDLAKEEFLDVFAEVMNRVKAAFPRDKKTQEIFFLRTKASSPAGDVDEEEEDDDAPADV